MQSDDPAFLPVGTEVSAKFKGAFCEAKIKKISKSVKCKVSLKEAPFGSIVVEDSCIRSGTMELNQLVEVQHQKQVLRGVIQHLKDCSTYHVVFNDGDEKVLRRTQVCLKGAKHFDSAVNLDALPLYNPEQFSSPVVRGKDKKNKKRKADEASPSKRVKRKKGDDEEDSDDEKSKKREKRAAASAASVAIGEMDQGDTEISCDGSSSGDPSDIEKEMEKDRKKKTDKEEEKKEKKTPTKSTEDKKEKVRAGDVMCVFEEAVSKGGKWFPAVVVSNKAYKKSPKARVLVKKEVPLRSFQNGKYVVSLPALLSPFDQQPLGKKVLDALSSALRSAVERAQAFVDKETLPGNWERAEIFGTESQTPTSKRKDKDEKQIDKDDRVKEKEKDKSSKKKDKEDKKEKEPKAKNDDKDKEKKKEKAKTVSVESDSSSSEGSDEEEYGEERDLFVAQLYKFQEERGTPINRAPVLGGKDIDLYRFYRVVQHYGGAKRATAHSKWKRILIRMKLEGCAGATPVTVRNAYIRYLSYFNSFYKNLGWSLDGLASTSTANSPRERRMIRSQTDDGSAASSKNKVLKRRKSTTADSTKEKATKKEAKDDDDKDTTDRESIADPKDLSDKDSVKEKEKAKEKVGVKPEKEESIEDIDSTATVGIAASAVIAKKEKEPKKEDRVSPTPSTSTVMEPKEKAKEKSKEDVQPNEKKKIEKVVVMPPAPEKEESKDEVEQVPVPTTDKSPKKDKDKPEKEKEREPRERIDSEKSTVSLDKESKKEKREGESEDEADGKKKKEKKKLSMKERPLPKDSTEQFKDPDEGYNQANILSHFYLGQKVRAQHHGRWYDARVVTVRQPATKELAEIILTHVSIDGTTDPPAAAVEKLHQTMTGIQCFVHYLGWNSRYDEWISLNKIRISLKDEQSSLAMLRREGDGRISQARLDWLARWSRSPQGVDSLQKDEETTPNMFTMGGYRPRRVSISQYEQINAAAEGLKREREPKGSPSRRHLASPPTNSSSPSASGHSPSVSGLSQTTVVPSIKTALSAPVVGCSPKYDSVKAIAETSYKSDSTNKDSSNVGQPVVSISTAVLQNKDAKQPPPVTSPSLRSASRQSESSSAPVILAAVTSSPVRESRRLRTASTSKDQPSSASSALFPVTSQMTTSSGQPTSVTPSPVTSPAPIVTTVTTPRSNSPLKRTRTPSTVINSAAPTPVPIAAPTPPPPTTAMSTATTPPLTVPDDSVSPVMSVPAAAAASSVIVSSKGSGPSSLNQFIAAPIVSKAVPSPIQTVSSLEHPKMKTTESGDATASIGSAATNTPYAVPVPIQATSSQAMTSLVTVNTTSASSMKRKREGKVTTTTSTVSASAEFDSFSSASGTTCHITTEVSESIKTSVGEHLQTPIRPKVSATPEGAIDLRKAGTDKPEDVIEPRMKRRRRESEEAERADELVQQLTSAILGEHSMYSRGDATVATTTSTLADETAGEREDREFQKLEGEAMALCQIGVGNGSVLGENSDDVMSEGMCSGAETPSRTDAEDGDGDKWSHPDTPNSGSRMMSPASSRGLRGMKRKRLSHNRHSQMVVDRKYIKHKPHKEKERSGDEKKDGVTEGSSGGAGGGRSDDEEPEDDGTTARATYIKQKNAMYKQMELEGSLFDMTPLGLVCISKMNMPDEELIDFCEARMQHLREIYSQSRAEIYQLEKRWRRNQEKKRERQQKEHSSASASATPSEKST